MVRLVVAGKVFTETFASFALADAFRSDLIQAINRAEQFYVATGFPVSKLATEEPQPESPLNWLEFSTSYVAALPIPPALVRILRAHITEFGIAEDGRVFRNERGAIGSTTYSRVWEEARHLAFTPAQAESPLAGRR